MGVPGENLKGLFSARRFVNWYNGHPDYQDLDVDLSNVEDAVIVGNGNVAVDVARILLKNVDELSKTDITEKAVQALRRSAVRRVHMIARRGPVQAAWTVAELRELSKLEGVGIAIRSEEISLSEADALEMKMPRAPRRAMQLLNQIAERPLDADVPQLHLRFRLQPTEVVDDGTGCVKGMRFERTRLEGAPKEQKAVGVGSFEEFNCPLVFRSVRFKGEPLSGLPWDTRNNVLPSEAGRVVDDKGVLSGVYCSGWVKRGPSGIVGTNIPDAKETVESVLADLDAATLRVDTQGLPGLLSHLSSVRVVDTASWERIRDEEFRRGEAMGKEQGVGSKLTNVEEMLKTAGVE